MAYVARTDGTIEQIDARSVTLERAQQIIGGYVELVASIASSTIIFLCDEDGLRKHLPVNLHGCDLYGAGLIVGDIIVLDRREAGEWLRTDDDDEEGA